MASPTGQTGHARYPSQLVLIVGPDIVTRVTAEATLHRLSKSEVTRLYLEAGLEHLEVGPPLLKQERPSWDRPLTEIQVTVSVSNAMFDEVARQATEWATSKSATARALILAGMAIADSTAERVSS